MNLRQRYCSLSRSNAAVRTAVIILTYNGRHLIDACLAAVRANTDLSTTQVVVVDNASKDGTADHVASVHPWVRIVRNQENLGFAGGVNTGMVAVKADGYVLLNTDAIVKPGWLARLVESSSSPGVGIVGAMEMLEDGRPRFGSPEAAEPDPMRRPLVPCERVSFACALIRREVIDRIGYLDHGYFMYHEDWDYCHRAKGAGFGIVFDPAVEVVHPGEASVKTQPNAWRTRVRTVSRLRYQLIHWGDARLARSLWDEVRIFGYWVKQGTGAAYLRGVGQAMRQLPDIRRRRRAPLEFLPP